MSAALKEQLDRRIIQTRKALSRIRIGKYGICENCGKMIDTDRLMVYPDATKCIDCENGKNK
ncbi:TraR/DksA C4-type zinc finger protein [Candidatus Microgenomates bacterium]|nr:TraR/DksA C4-type zinc finger protein [Candidatus Microgenomates bacterium]